MRSRYVFLFLLIVLAASAIYLILTGNRQEAGETQRVEKKRYIKSVYASGYVNSVNKVLIKPEVSGYIDRIYAREGDPVTRGQLLIIIKNDKLEENLKEIRARKELAQKRTEVGSDYIVALQDEVEIRKLELDIEKKNFDRQKSLFDKGIVSRQEYDQSVKTLGISERNHDRAVKNLNDAMDSLNADLKSVMAQEMALVKELEKHEIKSPVEGEVLRRFKEDGDYVNHMVQGNEILSVGDPEILETVLLVDEEYLPLIKLGDKVLVTTDAYPEQIFEGKVTLIEGESDRTSRTVKVKADIDYPSSIPVGITIEANIIVADWEGLFISKDAVNEGQIKIMKDGQAVDIPVKTGVEKGNYLEIEDGAEEDQEIITR